VLNALAHWNAFDVNRRAGGAVAERGAPAATPGEAGREEH